MTREEFVDTLFISSGIRHIQQLHIGLVDTIWLLRSDVIKKADELFDQHEEQIKQLKEYIDDLEYQLGMEVEKQQSFYKKGWKDRDKQSDLEH